MGGRIIRGGEGGRIMIWGVLLFIYFFLRYNFVICSNVDVDPDLFNLYLLALWIHIIDTDPDTERKI
jgi:hypothetical protein